MSENQTTKLWLWKNGDHFLAFDNPCPTYDGGDPMTLGEPVAVAILTPSTPGWKAWDAAHRLGRHRTDLDCCHLGAQPMSDKTTDVSDDAYKAGMRRAVKIARSMTPDKFDERLEDFVDAEGLTPRQAWQRVLDAHRENHNA